MFLVHAKKISSTLLVISTALSAFCHPARHDVNQNNGTERLVAERETLDIRGKEGRVRDLCERG